MEGVLTPRDELARSLSPLVAVAASQDAEELCQSNHIPSFADFMKPFGDHIEGRVSPRDWQGIPIAIDNFNVRFRPLEKLGEPNHLAVMSVVDDYVRSRHPQHYHEIKSQADVNDTYLDTSLDKSMPWYVDFRRMMLSLRGMTEHETFDHPVAIMIVISSTNPDPMGTINQLYNPNIPSFTVDRPYVDPNILRYYVLLHDPHRASETQAQETYQKMRKTLGLHCHLLRINSKARPPETAHLLDDDVPSAELDAEPAIRALWQQQLAESYTIESRMQSYAVGATRTSGNPTTASGISNHSSSSGGGGHTRSSSVSSTTSSHSTSVATPLSTTTTSTTAPLALGNTSLESEQKQQEELQQKHEPIVDETESAAITTQYGRYMTEEDVTACRGMTREFVIQSMIPFMERNIQHWNEQVASARRGLTGRLFGASRRLFGSTTRTQSTHSLQTIPATGPNVPAGVNQVTIYPYSAPEAQMRKLADYAFMIRDFKFAHTIYDTVRRDYATDKAYKYHAGTQEMIGICLLMMNQPLRSKTDVDRNFELAVQQYLGRCRSPFQATRTTIMYYELLKAHRMWKEVPTALVRMTGEDSDLRSALFLEQAAHCFLRTPKPMVRKYAFHVVMAAHRYGKALQREHALRCYQLASLIFEDHTWSIAQSHIQFALGRQSFHLGQLEEAVSYFANVLADSKQTPQQQAAHVREFMFIYRQYTNMSGIDPLEESLPNLGLPVINDQQVSVSLSNAQINNTDNQEEWASMERELLEQNIAKGFIFGSKKTLALQQQHDNRVVCAIGEPTVVHIEVSNPLQIAIQLNNIILGCEYRESMKPFKEKRDAEAEAYDTMVHGTLTEGSDDMYSFDQYELQQLNEITLDPKEKRLINLAIIPRKEGSILVKGVHYTLNGLVHRFHPIIKKGKRLNDTPEHKRSVVYGLDHTLDILVTSPMPLLDLQFHNVPETILSGEVVQTVLEINNKGNKGLTSLRLKSSHPSFICIGNPEEMDKQIYAGGNDTKQEQFTLDNKLYDPSVVSVPLPKKEGGNDIGVVNSGQTTLVPLWIRGDRIGKHSFKFLFSYQSEEDDAAIAHRTMRYTLNVQVLPSLKINAFTRPSAATINEYILGIEIENLQTVAGFQLTQLNAASPTWSIVPLSIQMESKQDIEAKTSVPPRQTTFAYYKISKLLEEKELTKPIELNITKLVFVSH
ncbi:ER-golgi trafficking TRAPP I complex 85 kDa subunit-domain-containing protein [Phascolomyces articulosus]|uniref:ER-golgi trafficking TRAPP I complex 85 kDa subunit-domain-containing protein n=1 Tax=Phascolomyces articulosus TaxID=60185 RepID=A0AAD5PH86_9FUNG|nr:ER-golgi trafficking TRAPP I complex 85 kDa subunit-domain-containing protein [Phascolomyces articulosus]